MYREVTGVFRLQCSKNNRLDLSVSKIVSSLSKSKIVPLTLLTVSKK